ncbi:hypothetical protein [Microbulbifer sp. YPW16]|uniref:hypothetical protein n=1 Tax=Microbulbifer sp. YPW16 TaxID=2904242 RepID=UPI001E33FB2F|nr:hypothetical protein [Microbulbifer sp. YPW16]UHQ55861.1 hypothetical protein LVE68_02405 [Microbulbifer sp. YPW16]
MAEGKPKKVFIHVGTFKTGTSSIQNFLYQRSQELLEEGVLYPGAGLYYSEPDVGIRHACLVYGDGRKRNLDKYHTNLVHEILASPAPVSVLSCEAWSRPSEHKGLLTLCDMLRAQGVEVCGVLYLRNYYDYVRSYYREFCLRRGNHLKFDEFYPVWRGGALSYLNICSQLTSIFNGKLCIRHYYRGLDVVQDLLSLIDIPHDKIPAVKKTSNPGGGAVLAEISRWANKEGMRVDKESLGSLRQFVADAGMLDGQGPVFTESPGFEVFSGLLSGWFRRFRFQRQLNRYLGWDSTSVAALFERKPAITAAQDVVRIGEFLDLNSQAALQLLQT